MQHIEIIADELGSDIICLQELKAQQEQIDIDAFIKLGYKYSYIRGEKAYNGVGIFSKIPLTNIQMLDFGGNNQARHIMGVLPNGTELHNFYVPAGRDEPDPINNPSFAHKLQYMDDIIEYWNKRKNVSVIILGDLNIAPYEHDVWSHKQLLKVISHTPLETERMGKLKDTQNFIDSGRHFVDMNEKLYSWWSYRNKDWKKSNRGRRLDHIWLTPDLGDKLISYNGWSAARDWVKPSDHVPITIEVDLE